MGIKVKLGSCIDCEPGSPEKPLTAKRCQFHYWNYRASLKPVKIKEIGKPIPRRSKKRTIQELQYNADVKIFLGKPENQICPVTGEKTTECHHKRGRIGNLLLDQRYWLAVSRRGHQRIENEPIWAKENGYSLNRLETI